MKFQIKHADHVYGSKEIYLTQNLPSKATLSQLWSKDALA